MWVFLSGAFLSIVADRNDADRFMVRARFKGDIERAFPDYQAEHTPRADYAYRCSISRVIVADMLTDRLMRIDYENFKNSVVEDFRHDVCKEVWTVMYKEQLRREPKRRRRNRKPKEQLPHYDFRFDPYPTVG